MTLANSKPPIQQARKSDAWLAKPYSLLLEIHDGKNWVPAAENLDPLGSTDAQSGQLQLGLSSGASVTAGTRLRLTVRVPLLNYGRVIIPDCGRHYVNSMKALDIRAGLFRITAPNAGHPFFALMDEAGNFMFAFGLLDADGAVEIKRVLPVISQKKAMVGGDEHLGLAFEWTAKADQASIPLYITSRQKHWFAALREYTQTIEKREGISQPHHPDAWRPVWCTWTAFPSAQMSEERVMENARIAREIGIGTIILDDGWFGPGLDDDNGVINHGDYTPDPVKLPDLPRLVKRVQALGHKFLLWHAPLCVAPESKAAAKVGKWFMQKNGENFVSVNGMYQLCPASPDVRKYVFEETYRLFKEYGVDGLKVDLYNCLSDQKCDSKQHVDDIQDPVRAVDQVMADVWAAALKAKPDAIMELKQDYGNVRLARHGTMVRAGDTAYDMDTNTMRCGYTQAFARCVHVDPVVTSVHTKPEAIALLALKSVTLGVPTYSMDLAQFSSSQLAPIKHWLGFYNQNVQMFMQPRQTQAVEQDVWTGGSAQEGWISILRQARVVTLPQAEKLHVMNGTGYGQIFLAEPTGHAMKISTWDMNGTLIGESKLPAGAREIVVPSGGRAMLVKA